MKHNRICVRNTTTNYGRKYLQCRQSFAILWINAIFTQRRYTFAHKQNFLRIAFVICFGCGGASDVQLMQMLSGCVKVVLIQRERDWAQRIRTRDALILKVYSLFIAKQYEKMCHISDFVKELFHRHHLHENYKFFSCTNLSAESALNTR